MKPALRKLFGIVLAMLFAATAARPESGSRRVGKLIDFEVQGSMELIIQSVDEFFKAISGMKVTRDPERIRASFFESEKKLSIEVNCFPIPNHPELTKVAVIAYAPDQKKADLLANSTADVIKAVKAEKSDSKTNNGASPQAPTPPKTVEQMIEYYPDRQEKSPNVSSLTFTFKTTVTTSPIVEVSMRAPKNGRYEPRFVKATKQGPSSNIHRINVTGLKGLTTYYFLITAPGNPGTKPATYSDQRSTSGNF